MAFKETISFGKLEIEAVGMIRNTHIGSSSSPARAELHLVSDVETYTQIKDEQRGFKIDVEGNPICDENGIVIQVVKTLDYEKTLLRIEPLNSRDLGPEKDAEFRDRLLALWYEYFGVGYEKV